MSRIRFEDLPSTDTPITAENLDKLNNLVISPTEPTTGEEVWIRKGKNIIPTNMAWEQGNINDSGVETASTNTVRSVNYIVVVPSQQYIASYNAGSGTSLNVVACYDENKQFISRLTSMGKNAFTLPANTKYIRPAFYNANGLTPAQVVSNITNKQIEQGSTATGYEAPVEKEIYCKNENGVYERFYSKKIENERGSLQYNSTYIAETPDINSYVRVGNVVKVVFRAKLASNIPNGTVIFNLPYKDFQNDVIMASIGGEYTFETQHFGYIRNSNGKEYLLSTFSGTNKWIHVVHTYICE